MKAIVFAGEGRVEVDDVPKPHLQEGRDALVEVAKSAICGSDLHVLHGKTPGMRTGGVLGHEFTGIVREVGDAATAFSPGERVLGSFLIACGECPPCSKKRFNHCLKRRALGLGSLTGDLDGAQAEVVRVPLADVNLLSLDREHPGLDDDAALFGGDILATAFYATSFTEVQPDEVVAVIGAGPVGLLTAAAARVRGATAVVLDTDATRVKFARERLGLDAFDVSEGEPQNAIATHTGGALADVTFDAVGSPPVLKSALRCTAPGGRVGVVGVYGRERLDLPLGVVWVLGLDLRFSGMANVQNHWREALDAVETKTIDPTALITHRLPLEEAVHGYELFESREAMKVVLEP